MAPLQERSSAAQAAIQVQRTALAAEVAADAALTAAAAALSAAEAAELVALDMDGDGVLGITTTGAGVVAAGVMVVVSSFLLQAARARAATNEARTIDDFIISPSV